jgi:hypothetical protein
MAVVAIPDREQLSLSPVSNALEFTCLKKGEAEG